MTTAASTSADETPGLTTTAGGLVDLRARLAETQAPMSRTGIDHVYDKDKMTTRKRIGFLLDEGSFVEINALTRHRSKNFGLDARRPVTDDVVTGCGTIGGRQVCVFSQDGIIFGSAFGEVHDERIVGIMDLVSKTGVPAIGIDEGASACIQEGVVSFSLYSQIFSQNTQASGVIPQIPLIMGTCAGGHVYSPTLTDFVVMVGDTFEMFITGPDAIKTVTGKEVTQEGLGGAGTHMSTSGTSHYTAADGEDALTFAQELVSYLPSNNRAEVPRMKVEPFEGAIADNITESNLELDTLIPDPPGQPYDIENVITRLVGDEGFLEIQGDYVQDAVIGFGRVEGRSAGFVVNQPIQFAGRLDIKASEKVARFVRTRNAFNTLIVILVDVPSFLPGADQGFDDIIHRGVKLPYTYAGVTVPKIMVTIRKTYNEVYCAMSSRGMGADINLAWPAVQIAVMGASGAVGFIYHKEFKVAAAEGKNVVALQKEYEAKCEATLANPCVAVERGFIDTVIPPSETCSQIIEDLRLLDRRVVSVPTKKHGNIPL